MEWFFKKKYREGEILVPPLEETPYSPVDKETGIKAIVISDSHGSFYNTYDIFQREKDVDLVIHCGDICKDKSELEVYANCPVIAVAGNCDFYGTGLSREESFRLGKYNVLVTHGHNYSVAPNYNNTLAVKAQMGGYDVVCFGHIHIPVKEEIDGVKIYNPGSIERPRTIDGRPSYGVITIDDAGQIDFEIKKIK